MRTLELNGKRLELVRGDITQESVDAIVNAANAYLAGGGGVDGAIHRAAGPALMEACRAVPTRVNGERCPAGEAILTTAGELPVRAVIHAVGPFWYDGTKGEPEALGSAHRRSLELAAIEGFESIAFPAISCGVYSYPVRKAARVALPVILEHLRGVTSLTLVRYVLFSEIDLGQFAEALEVLSRD